MATLFLYEDEGVNDLQPLTAWRTVFELRIGRKTLLDRAAQTLERAVEGVWTRDWMAGVAAQRCGVPANRPLPPSALLINGRWVCETAAPIAPAPCVGMCSDRIAYVHCDEVLAARLSSQTMLDSSAAQKALQDVPRVVASGWHVRYPWDLVLGLGDALRADFLPRDAGIEAELDARVTLVARDAIHVSRGAAIDPTSVVDASEGPVFISENVRIGPHCVIEGPAYIGPGTRINPHTWLHGANFIGPVCKIGGEIDGCLIYGYSNKQHLGFLGHAYVGSWVNIGAGTCNSDLKNTYGNVRVPLRGRPIDTGHTFFGAVIADHVKMAIHTTLPTGAVIGTASVLATAATVPTFVPPFTWLTDRGSSPGDPTRLLAVAEKAMARRNVTLTDQERELFLTIPEHTASDETT